MYYFCTSFHLIKKSHLLFEIAPQIMHFSWGNAILLIFYEVRICESFQLNCLVYFDHLHVGKFPTSGDPRNLKLLLNRLSFQMDDGSLRFLTWLILIILLFAQKVIASLKVRHDNIRLQVTKDALSFVKFCNSLVQETRLLWL